MSEELLTRDVQSMFREELIFIVSGVRDKNELIRRLGRTAEEKKLVLPSFTDAVIEREVDYPTGLSTEYINVAVPHTNECHVVQQAIIVAKLDEPIEFVAMGTDDEKVPVEYVFLLLLKNDNAQVPLLQKLMNMCTDKKATEQLKKAHTAEEILHVINGYYSVS